MQGGHAYLRETSEDLDIDGATVLIYDADLLQAPLTRFELRFHIRPHGNRNSIERIFC